MFDDALRTCRPPDDLPADLRPGGARVQPHRLLHVQAVHGRLGQRLPPQPLALAAAARRRSTRSATTSRCRAWRASFTYRKGGENTFMPLTAAQREAGADRPELHRRRDRAPAGADRDRLLDRQLLPPAVGHRASGRRSMPTGATRTAPAALRVSAPGPVRVPRRRRDGEPVPDGRRAAEGVRRRHPPQARSGRAGRAQHLRGDEGGQEGARSCRCRWARRSTRWRRTRSSSARMPDEMYRVFMHYKRDEWERFNATVTEWDLEHYLDMPALIRKERGESMCGIAGLIHRGTTGDIGTRDDRRCCSR